MSKALAAIACSVILTACANAEPMQLRGYYYWGHEVETFHPCNSQQEFWVVGKDLLLQPLRDKATELSRVRGQPYQPVYVETSGVPEGKASDGFAADYDGVYRFTAVRTVAVSGPPGCMAHG
jgi:hypothetical protein